MKGNCIMSRMQEEIEKHKLSVYCGIDVGKDNLDIFIHPIGVDYKIKNDKPEIIEAIQSSGKLDEDTENQLKQVIEEYKKNNA